MRIPKSAARFAAVGAFGFLVDGGVLTALTGVLGPYWARLPSFASAVTVTWLLNRRFTFRSGGRRKAAEGTLYTAVQTAGALANLGTYAAVMQVAPALADWPMLPLAVGAIAGMVVNFLGSSRLVFAPRPTG